MEKLRFSLFNIISILSLFAVLLFVFQLYFLKRKKPSKHFFSFYLITISNIVLFFLLIDLGLEKVAMPLLSIFMLSVLSIGPLLWMCINSVVGGSKVQVSRHLLLPFIVGVIESILLVLSYLINSETSDGLVKKALIYTTILALTLVFLMQNGYYIFQSFNLYKKHLKKVGEVFSYTEKVSLSWLKVFFYGYLVFIIGLVVSNILEDFWSDLIFHSVLFVYIIFSGYHALKQEPVFNEFLEDVEDVKQTKIDVRSDYFVQLKKRLNTVMISEKLYLDETITIHLLALKLKTNSKYLSQLINTEFNKSFVVFINESRIEHAKNILLDEDNSNLTIEAVGYDSGFKSKSALSFLSKLSSLFATMRIFSSLFKK